MKTGPIVSDRLAAALDGARAMAACYVVIHHLANANGFSNQIGIVFRFGQEAVLIFFLLSGFVIFANERDRALRPRGYLLRRLRRIYPPLVTAMIVSALIVLYNGAFTERFHPAALWGTIFALQDISLLKPGVITDPFLGNDPLWSLSYELFFYLIFPPILIAWYKRPLVVNHLIGAICCTLFILFAVFPNHFLLVGAYFLVWWAGAMAADAYLKGARNFTALRETYLWLIVLCLISAGVVLSVGYKGFGYYPFLMFRHFAIAAVLLALLFGPIGRITAGAMFPLRRVAVAIASISFGLYVLHYPILIQWNISKSAIGFIFALFILIITAFAAEHILPRLLPRAPKV